VFDIKNLDGEAGELVQAPQRIVRINFFIQCMARFEPRKSAGHQAAQPVRGFHRAAGTKGLWPSGPPGSTVGRAVKTVTRNAVALADVPDGEFAAFVFTADALPIHTAL
jgi:hypothetical protein